MPGRRLRAPTGGKAPRCTTEFLYAATMVTGPHAGASTPCYVRVARPSATYRRSTGRVQIIIWARRHVSVIIIAPRVSSRVSKRITRPILDIGPDRPAIRDGELRASIEVTTRDEIGTLASAINDMAAKLGNDITQLRKLERVRSEFLGNVSHELRTPIFSLQGFSRPSGRRRGRSVGQPRFLEKAHRTPAGSTRY